MMRLWTHLRVVYRLSRVRGVSVRGSSDSNLRNYPPGIGPPNSSRDHERHTGHFPDDVTPWIVDCQQCPAGERYLEERPARRWASVDARHTTHTVTLQPPTDHAPPEQITGDEATSQQTPLGSPGEQRRELGERY